MPEIYVDPRQIINSAMNVKKIQSGDIAVNVSNQDVPGNIAVTRTIESDSCDGAVFGVKPGELRQRVDEKKLEIVQLKNCMRSGFEKSEKYYDEIMSMFGKKGERNALSLLGTEMSVMMRSFAQDVEGAGRANAALSALSKHVDGINTFARRIQDLRLKIDGEVGDSIKEINNAIAAVVQANKNINASHGAIPDQDELRQAKAVLLEQLNIRVLPSDGDMNVLVDAASNLLVSGFESATFEFTPSIVMEADTHPYPVILTQISGSKDDMSAFLMSEKNKGRLQALMRFRDEILPDMQQQLDEYTRVLCDSANSIHNLGVSLKPSSTLTGTIGIPGSEVIDNETVISGFGTLRIGVMDVTTQKVLHHGNIDLTEIHNIGDLINAINTADIGVHALITGDGRLQIMADNEEYGIVMGSAGDEKALISALSVFDARYGYNPSHFFGLNNLFGTGSKGVGCSSVGLSSMIAIRSDIVQMPNDRLVRAELNSKINMEDEDQAIEMGDVSLLAQLSIFYDQDQYFNGTLLSKPDRMSLSKYADSLMAMQDRDATANKEKLERVTYVMEGLSKEIEAISGVDMKDELQKSVNIQTMMTYYTRIISIFNKISQIIFDL